MLSVKVCRRCTVNEVGVANSDGRDPGKWLFPHGTFECSMGSVQDVSAELPPSRCPYMLEHILEDVKEHKDA
jgi:hypothetical protein